MDEQLPLRKIVRSMRLPAVLCFGNPLLDIVVTLDGDELLEKYGLKVDGETELPEQKIQDLLAELPPELDQRISPGGCAQNTMRIIQWLSGGVNAPSIGIYVGGLGRDSRGRTLQRMVYAENVKTEYAFHPTLPTGVCVSLISGSSRSLAANLGAAACYTMQDLDNSDLPLEPVQIIYVEGFFVAHSLDVAKLVVEVTEADNKVVAFNLSGEYIFEEHQDAICEMVGLSTIVFGNVREMTALAKALNLKFRDALDIPFLLNNSKRVTVGVSNAKRTTNRWLSDKDAFVMTQGGTDPAIAVWGPGYNTLINPETPKDPIVDTTGAGDSLVAGFLAGVLAQWHPRSCLAFGCRVAAMMITRLGVTLPNEIPEELL